MKRNFILIFIAIFLMISPFFYSFENEREEKFSGTDTLAQKYIEILAKDYKRWFQPIFEPPSGEIESLLFTLQAAIGAGVMGYVMGYLKGKRVNDRGTD